MSRGWVDGRIFTNLSPQRTIIGSNQGGRVMSEVKYDSQPMALEKWLDENLNKKFPVQLPDGAKKWLEFSYLTVQKNGLPTTAGG